MESRHLGAPPGSGSGSGGTGCQSVDTSTRRRRRMSAPSTGTRLMQAFNAVSGDGDGRTWGLPSSSSSSGGLDLGLDESQPRYSRHRVYPEMSNSNMGRLLFQGSPLGSQTTDDDVLVMDGVLVANDSGSGPSRRASFTDLGFVNVDSPRSGGSRRYTSSRQFACGKENRVPRAMHPRHSEVQFHSGRSVQGASPKMQASPGSYHPLLPPSPWLQSPGPHTPGATTTPMRTPATAYFTPPRSTPTTLARAPASYSWTPKRPELKPPSVVQRATFEWPPTEEENASISQYLYGPRRATPRRLPVFVSICPA